MINIQLGSAITKEALQMSMSLAGLGTSMSMNAPSIVSVMAFISIMNIEIGFTNVSSTFANTTRAIIHPVTKLDATNLGTSAEKSLDWYFRTIEVDKQNDFSNSYYLNKFLSNSIGIFLGTFLLFDKLRKSMPTTDTTNPRY